MAFDTYMSIDGIKGESTDSDHKDWVATVRAGESSVRQVAERLGTSEAHLLSVNPQIKDPHNLKVGQEIQIPPHPNPKSESGVATSPAVLRATDLPNAPLGDPLTANMVKDALTAKDAKLDAEIVSIGAQMKEAGQKFANAMDAAETQMTLGIAQGVADAARGSQSSGTNLGQSMKERSGGNRELAEASMENIIGLAESLTRRDSKENLSQLSSDLAALENAKRQEAKSEESGSQGSSSGTQGTQNNSPDTGTDSWKFMKR